MSALNRLLAWLFDTHSYEPWSLRGWSAGLFQLHEMADLLAGLSYLILPVVLAYAAIRVRDDRRRTVVWLVFAAMLASTGLLNLLRFGTAWWPAYNLLGVMKLINALLVVSATALSVPALVQLSRFVSPEVHEAVEHENEDLKARLLREERAVLRTVARLRASPTLSANERNRIHDLANRVIENTDTVARLARGG